MTPPAPARRAADTAAWVPAGEALRLCAPVGMPMSMPGRIRHWVPTPLRALGGDDHDRDGLLPMSEKRRLRPQEVPGGCVSYPAEVSVEGAVEEEGCGGGHPRSGSGMVK